MRKIILMVLCLLITGMLSLSFADDQTTNQDMQKTETEQGQVMKEAKSLPSTLLTDRTVSIDEDENPWETQYSSIPSDID